METAAQVVQLMVVMAPMEAVVQPSMGAMLLVVQVATEEMEEMEVLVEPMELAVMAAMEVTEVLEEMLSEAMQVIVLR